MGMTRIKGETIHWKKAMRVVCIKEQMEINVNLSHFLEVSFMPKGIRFSIFSLQLTHSIFIYVGF
jgi:hypothetical protein